MHLGTTTIEKIQVSAYTIPTDFPESDGTLTWDKTTIVVVTASADESQGIGYTYADLSTAKLIHSLLAHVVEGRDAMDVSGAWMAMLRAVRNLGHSGIASMAISAIDVALWDLKARLLQVPLVKLLGAVRDSVPIYGSGGFTSYSVGQLQRQLSEWVSTGISMVKMKVGRNSDEDPQRVARAREAIGSQPCLFVDANGAYTRKQALSLAERFHEQNVTWFEEPVTSDDLEGLHMIRGRVPAGMDIAAGEYGYSPVYFQRMLDAGAVDVLQADATRCGGFTGFLYAGALCFARSLPLSAHTAPLLHAHVGCAIQSLKHVEYFHDHSRIEKMLFDGIPPMQNGALKPDLGRCGLGIELRRSDAARYAVE